MEYWTVITRPKPRGISLSASALHTNIVQLRSSLYDWLTEPSSRFAEWSMLCLNHSVTGAKCYDYRLVALMLHHNVDHILTFNYKDFSALPSIIAIDLATV